MQVVYDCTSALLRSSLFDELCGLQEIAFHERYRIYSLHILNIPANSKDGGTALV